MIRSVQTDVVGNLYWKFLHLKDYLRMTEKLHHIWNKLSLPREAPSCFERTESMHRGERLISYRPLSEKTQSTLKINFSEKRIKKFQ